jgi:hypothetical protein
MKRLFLFVFITYPFLVKAQEKSLPTDTVSIEGHVNTPLKFSLVDLSRYKTYYIDSLRIYNHLMEPKRGLKKIKGVLLKEVLNKSGFAITSPRLLSEFYVTCIASDGYKVVFSWNELFNTVVGDSVLIVIEEADINAQQVPERITLLSAADRATGRRYIKGLQKIIIERIK